MDTSFVILITASIQKTQSHLTAIKFVKELLKQNKRIRSVFFYQDGVSVGNDYCIPPSDEPQLTQQWAALADLHAIELQTCVAASLRRGIVDKESAKENSLNAANLNSSFKMTGLGQLAAAMSEQSSKLIHFK